MLLHRYLIRERFSNQLHSQYKVRCISALVQGFFQIRESRYWEIRSLKMSARNPQLVDPTLSQSFFFSA